MTDRLGESVRGTSIPGMRVVLDARPLQEPGRAPLTALYLRELLRAFDADTLEGESFAFLLQGGLADPTGVFERLAVIGRRRMPPTRLFRSGALTIDPFLLRGASLGAAWRAERGGSAGAVYHAAGGGVPLASGLPLVVTLLDLAPWELPDAFQRSPAARFGHRLRARILREAAAVIVPTAAGARAARRLLHLRVDRVRVVPLAPRPAFGRDPDPGRGRRACERLGIGERYFVYAGRFDARHDLVTLFRALGLLKARSDGPRDQSRPAGVVSAPSRASEPGAGVAGLPRILLVGASPEDRAAVARAAFREGVNDLVAYAPALDEATEASIVAGARAVLLPVLSDIAGLAALEAIACGTPVVAGAVGGVPELVGAAGILVEPRDPARLATALHAVWADDEVHDRLAVAARGRASSARRTWADVAAETRAIYAEAGIRGAPPDGGRATGG